MSYSLSLDSHQAVALAATPPEPPWGKRVWLSPLPRMHRLLLLAAAGAPEQARANEEEDGRQGKTAFSSPVCSQALYHYRFSKTRSDDRIQQNTKASSSIRCRGRGINHLNDHQMEMADLPRQPQHTLGACTSLCCQCTAEEQNVSILSGLWQEAAFHANRKVLEKAITAQGFHEQGLSCSPKASLHSRLANKSHLNATYLMLIFPFPSPFPTSTNFLQNPDGDLTAVLLSQVCLRINAIKIK